MQEQKRTPAEIFSHRLRELRGKRSQAEFAQFLGISQQRTYANYEKGRIPRGEVLEQICATLGISADYLLGTKNENEKKTEIECDLNQAIILEEEKDPGLLTDRDLSITLASLLGDFPNVPHAYQVSIWPNIEKLFSELRRRHLERVEAGREIRRRQREEEIKAKGRKP